MSPDLVSTWSAAATTSSGPMSTSTGWPRDWRSAVAVARSGDRRAGDADRSPDAGLLKALRPRRNPRPTSYTPGDTGRVLNQYGHAVGPGLDRWGEDGYLSADGHIQVADAALVALGLPPLSQTGCPCPQAGSGRWNCGATLRRERTHAAPWVERRGASIHHSGMR